MSDKAAPGRMRRSANGVLAKLTGYQLIRADSDHGRPSKPPLLPVAGSTGGDIRRVDRLVPQPTFLVAASRSGLPALAKILDNHSMICAPDEVQLRFVTADAAHDGGSVTMEQQGLDPYELEYLLWDRLLERELTASQKPVLVEKAPNVGYVWKRLREAWPAARYVFLIRHPVAIAESMSRARKVSVNDVVKRVLDQGHSITAARLVLPGPTIRYEDLVADPVQVTKEICTYLDLDWEPAMLGDNGAGRVKPEPALPSADQVHPLLRDLCRSWGYLA
jgi:Sulfotransferase family